MTEPLQVTLYDPETGETATAEIPPGSYLLLCVEPCHRTALNAWATGTHQITVKGVTDPMAGTLRPKGDDRAETLLAEVARLRQAVNAYSATIDRVATVPGITVGGDGETYEIVRRSDLNIALGLTADGRGVS